MTTTYEEILAHARHLKQTNASITDEELRQALNSRFLGENTTKFPLPTTGGTGCIPEPFGGVKTLLSLVVNGTRLLFTRNQRKRVEILSSIIADVIVELTVLKL
jgi:hypothetical protein